MFPIEVTWQPASNNSSTRRGVWVDTVSIPEKTFTDGTYVHKAVIVDFESNAISIIAVGQIRTLDSFIGGEDDPDREATEQAPRPINLYGRRVTTGRPDSEQAE